MKKLLIGLLAALFLIPGVAGCKSGSVKKDPAKLQIVCTIFPCYDWVKQVLGDRADHVNITFLSGNGVDLHSYQPLAKDIVTISDCDLFIYVGGTSDSWAADAIKKATNKDMKVISLLEKLGDSVKEEQLVDGMQQEEHAGENEHEEEWDEHVWLSPQNAELIVNEIAKCLATIDATNAQSYQKNSETYIGELKTLSEAYRTTVNSAKRKTLLFGDRFPFRYLTDAYGLTYYAAFAGCSSESEASFETIAFLSKKVDELNLPVVMTIDTTNRKIAQTIINSTQNKNQKILALNSMQSTTLKDSQKGTTYLSIMQDNLNVLRQALN